MGLGVGVSSCANALSRTKENLTAKLLSSLKGFNGRTHT